MHQSSGSVIDAYIASQAKTGLKSGIKLWTSLQDTQVSQAGPVDKLRA